MDSTRLKELLALSLYCGSPHPLLSFMKEEVVGTNESKPTHLKTTPHQQQAQMTCDFEKSMRGDYD